ncbi:helix-turn-helix transcriptional regulator [Catellatospora sp. KI3]|uniref:helix-turn-helix domain-containing protein n=1 Tax=Catellatospora sp. KI3 TaxID=3041620 RepID=UPI002482EF03|nr:helix-turn-helix transcriptional regulator [Catellatospora sp. KI3]MDI1461958.1 helix-turn-helix transcriptional regulator [Catellatospora sp. KI3]
MKAEQASLARRLGRLLRDERERRGLSQQELALRAEVSQQHISRMESGRRSVSSAYADRIFGLLGLQLRVEVEAAGSHLDEVVANAAANLRNLQFQQVCDIHLLTVRAPGGLRYVLDGPCAAVLQGVPVEARHVDMLMAEADVEVLAAWMLRKALPRWDERTREFSGYLIDPRDPGPLRWGDGMVELRVRLVPELPRPVLVEFDGELLPVRPLPAVESDHPEVAWVLGRLRERPELASRPAGQPVGRPAGQAPPGGSGESTSAASTMV